ncbi:MAG TPA: iron-containing alcohol dehydrogenase [Bryocella sp.]|nr:iron-containing alcohol dehydrogenase [Bryocella sp.]
MTSASCALESFSFNTTTLIRFGCGAIADLPSAFRVSSQSNILVVTDPGIIKANLLDVLLGPLATVGINPLVYDKVVADPPERIVNEAIQLARSSGVNAVIGFGGGSSLDVAKLVALLANSNERLQDIYGVNKVRGDRLRLALVPTTAGTGSEVTGIAVVTTGAAEKKGVASPTLLPDLALLDPELTLSLPPTVTAATGVDAMVHAIEAYTSVNPNNNPISKMLARQALSLLAGSIRTAVKSGSDTAARGHMLLGSMMAGQAFANSPVAAVHALAYPLGGHFHLAHGITNALVLPHVLRFNADVCGDAYAELALAAFPHLSECLLSERACGFISELIDLAKDVGLPQRLRDLGVEQSQLAMLADDAMKQTRLLINNPKTLTRTDVLAIYEAAW